MITRLPPLNAIKAFESAARHLSFTKAADELFVTQAAISHQIKSLESHLSIKLFHRKNRTLLLTEEGQAYFHDLKDIFINLQEATQRLSAMSTKGTITIATPPSFASQWLMPRLHEFSASYPDIDVRLKAVDLNEGFIDDSVDIAVYYGRGIWPNLVVSKLITEYLTPMCSPLLLETKRRQNIDIRSLADLKEFRLLHDSTRLAWKNWLNTFSISNVNVSQGPIFSHTMLVLQAAANGQGLALSDTVLAKPDIRSGRLVCPFNEKLESKNSYYLVAKAKDLENIKVSTFNQWMLSQAEV